MTEPAQIYVGPDRVKVLDMAGDLVVHFELKYENRRKDVRKLAAQMLEGRADAVWFVKEGTSYRLPVGPDLASRLAKVAW